MFYLWIIPDLIAIRLSLVYRVEVVMEKEAVIHLMTQAVPAIVAITSQTALRVTPIMNHTSTQKSSFMISCKYIRRVHHL